jgi:3-methyladenine DNA glycosylase AlkD
MENAIRKRLFELADEKYRLFHSGLVPGADNILGVRLPRLRELAKELAKNDWRDFLATAQEDYYEEIMLQGLVIGYAKADIEEILRYTTIFVPKITNWGICDSFCSTLKITRQQQPRVWEFLQPYLLSHHEFQLRFAIVMMLGYYLDSQYIDRVLLLLDGVKHDGYYVKMAVAWTISICFIKYPEKTMTYLKNNTLDDFTYNKTLQKITESLRVNKVMKITIGNMKRKITAPPL